MKVLQINSVCGIGSTGRIATDIHQVLIEQGHESWIAYGRGKAYKSNNTIKVGNDFSNYLHVAQSRLFDGHGFGSIAATKSFIKKVDDLNPDIIHLHNIHGYYINIEILFEYLKSSRKPVVWTMHDCWAFTGHCAYFDYVGCEKWKFGCEKCPQKKVYPKTIGFDNSKLNYQKKKALFTSIDNMTIVTPSKWLANLVEDSFLGKYPIKVINNGIDLDVFKPTSSNFREKYNLDKKFIVLGVANVWDRRKGLTDILDLSKRLDDKYKIVIVGLNKKQLDDIPENIIGITRTNNIKELVEIYSEANVFLNPTTEDNFPTTNLEALACGTPVITYATGGSVESIDKSCGVVTEEKNELKVYEAIQTIKWAELSQSNCLKRAGQYDKVQQAINYNRIYVEVLK
jgi:putative colanic acid biosynthesis glycosyltransferase